MLPDRKKAAKALVERQKAILATLYHKTGYTREWEDFILQLPEKKLSGLSQRAQFVRFMYDYIIEFSRKQHLELKNNRLDDDKVDKLAVLAELVIDCQYYENYVFDGKSGVTTPDQIRKYINAAAHLKSVVFQFIRDNFTDDYGTEEKVRASVDLIFNLVNLGQQIEAEYNRHENYSMGISKVPNFGEIAEKEIDGDVIIEIENIIKSRLPIYNSKTGMFLKTYLKRLNLTSGQLFYQFTNLLFACLNFPVDNRKAEKFTVDAKQFAQYLGCITQLINDNIDSVELSTGSKIPEDAFSDLKNKNVTFPLLCTLQLFPDGVVKDVLNSTNVEAVFIKETVEGKEDIIKISPQFKPHIEGELNEGLSLAIPAVELVAVKAMDLLETSSYRTGLLLYDMLTIAFENRFYDEIRKSWTYTTLSEPVIAGAVAEQVVENPAESKPEPPVVMADKFIPRTNHGLYYGLSCWLNKSAAYVIKMFFSQTRFDPLSPI